MRPQQKPMAATVALTDAEWHALCTLRTRYQEEHDLFLPRELSRLRFLRWLYQTGRLAP